MKNSEVSLGYFKKGDDMHFCLEETKGNVVEALRMHSAMLTGDAKTLSDLADALEKSGEEVEMQADTHMIYLTGSDGLIDELITKELVVEDPFEDEEDDDFLDDDDDEEDDDEE